MASQSALWSSTLDIENELLRTSSAHGSALVATVNGFFERADGIEWTLPSWTSGISKIGLSCGG